MANDGQAAAAAPAQESPKPGAAGDQINAASGSSTDVALGGKPKSQDAAPVTPDATQTKPEADQKKDAPKPDQKPEKYELKVPDGSPLSAQQVEKVASHAKEQGLSSDQAQALLEREHQAVSSYVQNQNETATQKIGAWVEEIKADKELGGEAYNQSVENARRVIDRFGSDVLKQELSKTGLGNHPELVRVFARIGKSMADDTLVVPSAHGAGKKSIEEIFYPNYSKSK